MSEWNESRLGDIVIFNPDSIKKGYPHSVVEYLDIASVGSNICYGTQAYDVSDAPGRAKRLVCDGDTIFSTVRPNLKTYLKIRNPKNNLVVSTGFAVMRPKEAVDSDFLFYSITNQSVVDELSAIADSKTTSYPAVTPDDIAAIKIVLPDKKTQVKIGSILSAYDNLIENNNRRIAILEEMAQRLYREWFVHFRFPGHKNVEMVESELGLIPEGWEACELGNFLDLKYGKALKKEERDGGKNPVYGSSGEVGQHSKYLVNGPGIIVGRKGNVGSVYFSHNSFYPIDTVYYIESKLSVYFLYYLLKNITFISGDSAVPGLNREFAIKTKVVLPDDTFVQSFTLICKRLMKNCFILEKQNQNLRKTRDHLLPRLISGDIDVSDLPIKVKED